MYFFRESFESLVLWCNLLHDVSCFRCIISVRVLEKWHRRRVNIAFMRMNSLWLHFRNFRSTFSALLPITATDLEWLRKSLPAEHCLMVSSIDFSISAFGSFEMVSMFQDEYDCLFEFVLWLARVLYDFNMLSYFKNVNSV